jgi:hypothetical protein
MVSQQQRLFQFDYLTQVATYIGYATLIASQSRCTKGHFEDVFDFLRQKRKKSSASKNPLVRTREQSDARIKQKA